MCAWGFVSEFLPYNSATLVSGLGEYADGCRSQKGWYPFCLVGGTGRGVWGVGGLPGVSCLPEK